MFDNNENNCFKKCFLIGPTGPQGLTGPAGGATGATERLFKSSNRIIIDSS